MCDDDADQGILLRATYEAKVLCATLLGSSRESGRICASADVKIITYNRVLLLTFIWYATHNRPPPPPPPHNTQRDTKTRTHVSTYTQYKHTHTLARRHMVFIKLHFVCAQPLSLRARTHKMIKCCVIRWLTHCQYVLLLLLFELPVIVIVGTAVTVAVAVA